MLKIEKLSDELEAIVDRTSLTEVLEALALMSSAKADHIRKTWQDEKLAKHWEKVTVALLDAERIFTGD